MTPKEKATELITKFQHPICDESDTDCLHIEVAKEFALITINEVINHLNTDDISICQYWYEVKQEIEKL